MWLHIKRLKDPELRGKKGKGKAIPFMHVCVLCWDLLTLTRDKAAHGRFLTTLALTHLRRFHSQTDLSVKSQAGLDAKGRHRTVSLLFAGSRLSSSSAGVGPAAVVSAGLSPSYYVSPSDLALSNCARFYVYGKAALPKQMFDDDLFRDMCQGFFDAGGGSGKAPFLTAKGLKAYVVAEYGIFKAFARFMVNSVVKYAKRACGPRPARELVHRPGHDSDR